MCNNSPSSFSKDLKIISLISLDGDQDRQSTDQKGGQHLRTQLHRDTHHRIHNMLWIALPRLNPINIGLSGAAWYWGGAESTRPP